MHVNLDKQVDLFPIDIYANCESRRMLRILTRSLALIFKLHGSIRYTQYNFHIKQFRLVSLLNVQLLLTAARSRDFKR